MRRAIFERVALTLKEFREWRDFTILDVGCGSGRNDVALVNSGAARVVGIDFSERMLEIARGFSRSHGTTTKCEFVRGDFVSHNFDQSFDAVIALGFFDYIGAAEDALRRMISLSRYKVIASFPKRSMIRAPLRKLRYALKGCPVYFYTRDRLTHICRRLGLKDFQVLPCTSAGFLLVVSLNRYPSSSDVSCRGARESAVTKPA